MPLRHVDHCWNELIGLNKILNKISRPNAYLSTDGCEVYSSQGPIYINLYPSATNTNTSPALPSYSSDDIFPTEPVVAWLDI